VERASPLEEAAIPAGAVKAAGAANQAAVAAAAAEPLWAGEAEEPAGSPSGSTQAVTER
jgi:hypothetical protein